MPIYEDNKRRLKIAPCVNLLPYWLTDLRGPFVTFVAMSQPHTATNKSRAKLIYCLNANIHLHLGIICDLILFAITLAALTHIYL